MYKITVISDTHNKHNQLELHGGYGYLYKDGTYFINASVLDEDYIQKNTPLTFNWDNINNTIEFI